MKYTTGFARGDITKLGDACTILQDTPPCDAWIRERPYLRLRLVLDPSVVTSVMVESAIAPPRGDGGVNAVNVSALDASLLDATLRLVRLVDAPGE